MQEQHEVLVKKPLLDDKGNIAEPGYAKRLNWEYDNKKITAKRTRLKEWDYYYISNKEYALCLTIADMGYVGALSISVIDFVTPAQFTNSSIFFFPMGKLKMPATFEKGDCFWKNGKTWMKFENDGTTRRLTGEYPNADKRGTTVKWDVTLTDAPEECMVIATPFDRDGYFYFNSKVNCMSAEGSFSLNGRECPFNKEDSMGTLDWGRGVWTYDNTWYWGSLHTRLKDGKTFGFNLGYGFGNTSSATEDMLFYDGKAHKLPVKVVFGIPGDDEGKPRYMEDWTFKSEDGRMDLTFTPIIDRYEPFDLKVMCMIPHQVFGWFTGTCTLDDGTVIELDHELGFAEKVHNKW